MLPSKMVNFKIPYFSGGGGQAFLKFAPKFRTGEISKSHIFWGEGVGGKVF